MNVLNYCFVLLFLFSNCKSSNQKRIHWDDQIAEGDISIGKDTVFNGTIKFFDSSDNKLVRESFYVNDTLQGEQKDYYKNGKIASIVNYRLGEENGLLRYFDSSGNLAQTSFYYYGLAVGPLITYQDSNPSSYSFYTFDGQRIFKFFYDTKLDSIIQGWRGRLFFYSENFIVDDYESKGVKKLYFIYLPNPPELKFEYSICIMDNKEQVVRTLEKFNSVLPWSKYSIASSDKKPEERFAIYLTIQREGKEVFKDYKILE